MIGVLQCDRYYRYAGPPHEVEGLKIFRAALLVTQTHVAFIIIPPRSAVELIYNMPSSHCPESWWWIYQKRNWRWLLFRDPPFRVIIGSHVSQLGGLVVNTRKKSVGWAAQFQALNLSNASIRSVECTWNWVIYSPVDLVASQHFPSIIRVIAVVLGIEEGLLLASQIWLLEVLQTDWSQGHNEKRCQNSKWESIKTKPQSGNYFGGFLKDLLFQWFTTINALWSNTNCHLDSSKQHKIPR